MNASCGIKTPQRKGRPASFTALLPSWEGRKKGREEARVTILLEIGPANRYKVCTLAPAFQIKPKLLACEDADSLMLESPLSAPTTRMRKIPLFFHRPLLTQLLIYPIASRFCSFLLIWFSLLCLFMFCFYSMNTTLVSNSF